MALYFLSPGVYPETIDLSDRTQAPATSVAGIVLLSNKGPMERTFVSSTATFKELYGVPDVKIGWGHHTAMFFLAKSSQLYVKRVAKGSKYAGAVVFNDRAGTSAARTYLAPFKYGRINGYSEDEAGSQVVYAIKFSGPIVTGQSLQATFNPNGGTGPTALTAPITFNTTSDNTLRLFAAALENLVNISDVEQTPGYWNAAKSKGTAGVIAVGSAAADDRIVYLIMPEDSIGDLTAVTVSGTGTPPTAIVSKATALFEIFAENPGAWGNDVGFQIRDVDLGTKARRKLVFTKAMTSGQTFTVGVQYNDSYAQITPVNFATDWPTTLAAIKTALDAALNGMETGWVTGLGTDGLSININAPTSARRGFNFDDQKVTTTSSGAIVTSNPVSDTIVIEGVDAENAFDLWVYTRGNVNAPAEKYRVSLQHQIDGFGEQMFIEDAINKSAGRSSLIRVLYNDSEDSATGNSAGKIVGIGAKNAPTPIQWLSGGADLNPSTIGPGDLMTAWNDFKDRRKVAIRLMLNGGLTDVAVQRHMCSLAESRRDCFAILDMPSNKQSAQDAVIYRREEGNFNTSYAAIYTPNVGRIDEFTNRKLFIPPSGFVGAQYAESDRKTAEWFAPAGLNRGLIDTIELRYEYDEGEIELLFSNQINPIVKKAGKGYPIWGAETLQSKASALSNISVRRLLITIELTLVDALEYQVYEPNDPYTWFQATQICNNLLQPIKEKRGLYAYLVVANQINNKPYHIDMGLMNVDVLLKPVLPVKFIRLSSIVSRTGAVFSEILGLLNGGGSLTA